MKKIISSISKQKKYRPSNEENFLLPLYEYHTHTPVITIHAFPAHPHFLAHQALFLAQQLPVPLLRHSSPLCLPHPSACLFWSHPSDPSSEYPNQVCHWIIVSSLLCGDNREDAAPRAKGVSLLTPPSYIRSFLSLARTALQHESNPADVLFRLESQMPPQLEKTKCRLWEQHSLGWEPGGFVPPALHPSPRNTHCSFLEGSFLTQCSG